MKVIKRTKRALLVVLTGTVLLAGCSRTGGTERSTVEEAERTTESADRVSTVGLDSVRLAEVLDRATELPQLHTLLVARHGEIQAAHHFRGPGLDAVTNVKSVSKSILSALVGIAIEERHLEGVNQSIAPFFEDHLGADADSGKQMITIGHLLSMQSGLERTSGGNYGRWVSSANWVRYAITRPLVEEPGGRRLYSTGNTHLLSAILTQATGQNTWSYAHERLVEPLGLTLPRWTTDPQGIFMGGNNMELTPRDLVRFGELYRNDGRLDGQQIIPSWWVRASLTPRTPARRRGEGYGYGWFTSEVRGHPMFYAWGYGGQYIFVVPDLELTVVMTSDPHVARRRSHRGAVRRLLADGVVPAAEMGAGEHTERRRRTASTPPLHDRQTSRR